MDPQKVFRFCLKCGASWKFSNKNKFNCPQCGFVYYFNPLPCAVLLIVNAKDELLLVQRKFAPFAGSWDIPGGFIELGETVEEAARREAMEELGLSISKLTYLTSYADRYEYYGVKYHTIGFLFSVYISGKDNANSNMIKANDDAAAVQFFSRENIPWEQIKFPTVKQGIKKYFVDKN